MKIQHLISISLVALAAGCSKAPPMATRTYPLGADGTLSLSYPPTWAAQNVHPVEREATRTSTFDGIQFTPTNGERCAFLIELMPVSPENRNRLDLKALLAAQIPKALSNSPPPIQELKGEQASGYYFRLVDPKYTNAAPPPGEFKFGTEGFAKLGPLVLVFKMVNDDPASEPEALEVIRSAKIVKP